MDIFSTLNDLKHGPYRFALCTVVHVSGSTPRKAGAKMIVIDDMQQHGSIIGTIGGGAIEHYIREEAMDALRKKRPRLVQTSLRNELGMCCGGEMTVFIEPIEKAHNLICFGAGHIAQALCPLAVGVGFAVSIVDERKNLLSADAFSRAIDRYDDTSRFVIDKLPLNDDAFVVIATHDHDLDQKMVELIIERPFMYAALVGSQRKAFMTEKRLRAKGFSEAAIKRIVCPAGLSIFAQTPEEIAISIVAQMIMVRNNAITNWDAHCSSRTKHAHGIS